MYRLKRTPIWLFQIGITLIVVTFTGSFYDIFANDDDDENNSLSHSSTGTTIGVLLASNQNQKKVYITTEILAIQEQAARGNGPHLEALAQVLQDPDKKSFGSWMQSNYQILFAQLDRPEDLLIRIQDYRRNGFKRMGRRSGK